MPSTSSPRSKNLQHLTEQSTLSLLSTLGDNIILMFTLNNHPLSIPLSPHCTLPIVSSIHTGLGNRCRVEYDYGGPLAFLSCCRAFYRIKIPVTMNRAQYHTRTPRRFQIQNASLAGDAINDQQLEWVASHNPSQLASLTLSPCRALTDLSALALCTVLTQLTLSECHKVTDLSALQLFPFLEQLVIVSCFGVRDASPLLTCHLLTKLRLENNIHLVKTSMLEDCVRIEELVVIKDNNVYERKAGIEQRKPTDLRKSSRPSTFLFYNPYMNSQ